MTDEERQIDLVRREAALLIRMANLFGLVVTIEQKPLEPFAAGHYESVADVRIDHDTYRSNE